MRGSGFLNDDPFYDDLLLGMAVTRAIGVVCARLGHILDDSQSFDDCAERRVVGMQRWGVAVHEEELAAVRARAGVGHGHGARGVPGASGVLVRELVARTPIAGPGRVSALKHVDRRRGETVAVGV